MSHWAWKYIRHHLLLHVLCPQAGSYVQRRHFSLFSVSLFSPLYPSSANIQSSSIVFGLPRIFSPSILPSMMSLSRVSLLKMCPIHFFCRPRIVPISVFITCEMYCA